ncbi:MULTISPECIES: hypothetical protein [Stenotrophomonas]|jgi:hypothetical protein|uniref:hypothetical protein n=1 Tax=Stenotrophomonas TaxID=40323 RepID=UPI0018D42BD4|nr:hypothetical protein [Stenotrophomonas sp.]MBH1508848.1 hypothetical protein [Stenotrophomonas maltophilia]
MKSMIVMAIAGLSLLVAAGSANAADPYPRCTACSRVWAECVANNGADHPICQHKQLVCDQICAWEIPVVGAPYALDRAGADVEPNRLELALSPAKRLSRS